MELAKNIFFFIGSILGIAGFINSVIQPLLSDNREKWKKISKVLDEEFFINLEHCVHEGRYVHYEQLKKIRDLKYDIEEEKTYLHLKFPFQNIFEKHSSNLCSLIKEFDKKIAPPIWERRRDPDTNEIDNRYTFRKQPFREESEDHREFTNNYVAHLEHVTDLVLKMRYEFKTMEIIANLNFFEIPFYKSRIESVTSFTNKIQ